MMGLRYALCRGFVSDLMPQQRQEKRQPKQRGHSLPKLDRVTFVERPRLADRNGRSCRSRLHLHREFDHVAKPFGGIDGNRFPERALEPRWEIWAQRCELKRPLSARRAGHVGIAIRELAGEGAKHGDA